MDCRIKSGNDAIAGAAQAAPFFFAATQQGEVDNKFQRTTSCPGLTRASISANADGRISRARPAAAH
jgi:hypothetical protein